MQNYEYMKNFEIKLNILNITLFIIAVSTFVFNIIISDRVSTSGTKLTAINQQIEEQKKYNLLLSYEYFRDTSSSVVYNRAVDAGFIKAGIEYLETQPLAYR